MVGYLHWREGRGISINQEDLATPFPLHAELMDTGQEWYGLRGNWYHPLLIEGALGFEP
jgi:hypothetical protein